MPVYKLPTRSPRKYRGKYPHRVRSFGAARGCIHIELNGGSRFVATYDSVPLTYLNSRDHTGVDFWNRVVPRTMVHSMTWEEYAGILIMGRIVRFFRHGYSIKNLGMR